MAISRTKYTLGEQPRSTVRRKNDGKPNPRRALSAEERPRLVTLIDQCKITSVESLKRHLKEWHDDETYIDETDDLGRTPLMIACRNQDVYLVQLLLERYASPNVVCNRNGDTAFHFLCQLERDPTTVSKIYKDIPYSKGYRRRTIAKMLLDHGAIMRRNALGLSPVLCAAIRGMKFLVEFLLSDYKAFIPKIDQINALEILGSKAACYSWAKPQDGFPLLLEAMQLRYSDKKDVVVNDFVSPLQAVLRHAESKTIRDLEKIKGNEEALLKEAFLIRDRILPGKLKSKYLWESLVSYACGIAKHGRWEDALGIVSYGINLELSSNLPTGMSLGALSEILCAITRGNYTCPFRDVHLILESFVEVLIHVKCSSMSENVDEIIGHIASMLLAAVDHYNRDDQLEAVCQTMQKMMNIVEENDRQLSSTRTTGQQIRHVSIIDALIRQANHHHERCSEAGPRVQDAHPRNLKRLLHHLLTFADLDYTTDEGDTLLHVALDQDLHSWETKSIILTFLVKYGCPFNRPNNNGEVVMKIAARAGDGGRVLKLLQSLYCDINLEVLAAKVVRRNRLPYKDYLPSRLHKVIEIQ